MNPLLINSLFQESLDREICFAEGEPIFLSTMLKRVYKLASSLTAMPKQKWILASDSTINFLGGFLALLIAGKEVLLPPNNLPGTINETLIGAEGLLTDLEIDTDLEKISLLNVYDIEQEQVPENPVKLDVENLFVQICTSGSTGEPKQIRKSLKTLEDEINSLERLWGIVVANKTFVSTVSHQHIYGLLFRVLWPLLSGRPFMNENVEYPEQIESLARRYGQLVLVSSPAYLKRMSGVLHSECVREYVSMIFSSGGPLAHETSVLYTREYGITPMEVLGSTETGGIAWRQQQADQEVLWHKFDEVEIRRQDESGVLMVRSPFCFNTEWYEMGDAVELVNETQFRLLGRVDRIVKLEEKRISLDRMEATLAQSDLVDQVKIVVLEGYRTILGAGCILTPRGEKLLADKGRRAVSEQLKAFLAAYFDRVTLPRKWRYIPDFPYNTQGKITQADLLRLFEDNKEENND